MTSHEMTSTRTGRDGWLSCLLSGRGVLAFWILYSLGHAVFRLSVSHTLSLDDSRSNELAQELALGYQNQQPPLYEWLLWTAQQFLGTGIESTLFVRYTLIAAIGIACYGAVRAALKDDRWAAVASLSLAASYPVGWTFHEWATQTVLLCIACFATLHAAINWIEKPSLRSAFWFGVAIGLGLLSKFSYILTIGGLLIAMLSMPETRRALCDRRLLLTAAIAMAMIAPYIFWLVTVDVDVAAAVAKKMILVSQPYSVRVLKGLGRLASSIPLFLLPWLLFIGLLAPKAFGFGKAAVSAGLIERLALRTMIAAAILAALGIIAIGATNIAERYMHAIVMIAPIYVFARIRRFDPAGQSMRPIVILVFTLVLIVIGIRVAAESDSFASRRASRLWQIPFQSLAEQLKQRGIDHGTVITIGVREAGNLRAFLPHLRVIARDSLRVLHPALGQDASLCVLVYPAGDAVGPKISAAGPPERIEALGRTAWFGYPRSGTWFVAKLDPQSPMCR
jgi:4-amino-4-deoxy-L-arabinose transferase-like glycosyltransferase